ncbi:MAG TPA: hypothetical protein VHG09_14185 [Longimicrobiales bacterium]|nr:hypothetical protein [Longimicrobiales bacterium]
MTRRLLTTRRHVPLDRADDYLEAWDTVRDAVEGAGGRAWIFRGAAHEDQFMEFVEWTDDEAPTLPDGVSAARAQLDAFAVPGVTEEWEDVQ